MTWRSRATSASRKSRTRASALTPVSARIFFAFEGPIPKMYGRAYWIFLSGGRSTPAMRAIPYPCRCLCLGLRLQMTRITPRRLITLQCSQIGLTLVRTFNAVGSGKNLALGKNPIKSRTIDGVVSSRKGRNYGVLRSSTRAPRPARTAEPQDERFLPLIRCPHHHVAPLQLCLALPRAELVYPAPDHRPLDRIAPIP